MVRISLCLASPSNNVPKMGFLSANVFEQFLLFCMQETNSYLYHQAIQPCLMAVCKSFRLLLVRNPSVSQSPQITSNLSSPHGSNLRPPNVYPRNFGTIFSNGVLRSCCEKLLNSKWRTSHAMQSVTCFFIISSGASKDPQPNLSSDPQAHHAMHAIIFFWHIIMLLMFLQGLALPSSLCPGHRGNLMLHGFLPLSLCWMSP